MGRSRDDVPARLRLGRGHRRVPDRGRGATTTAAASRSGTASAARPAASRRRHGDVACDHYHRWREDVALMASLGRAGATASRSRGRASCRTGAARRTGKGIDFYGRLVDGLLERGIAPLATLYHWDLPQALQDEGGWAARETVDRFVDYARARLDGLGDRVEAWITHNEPWCGDPRLRVGDERAGPAATGRPRSPRPPPAALPRARPCRRCAPAAARGRWASR